jgi:pyroglutamyl-peptidase
MLGQSGKSDSVKIERIAVNLMDAKKPDNDGYTPDEEFILNDGPSAYFSSLPVKHLRNQLFKSGVPAEVSNTAGLYVCNTTYYAALHHISITDKNFKTIFVHLPKISDEWPVLKMKDVVKQLIITINQKS